MFVSMCVNMCVVCQYVRGHCECPLNIIATFRYRYKYYRNIQVQVQMLQVGKTDYNDTYYQPSDCRTAVHWRAGNRG